MQPFGPSRDGIPRLAASALETCWHGECLEGRQRGTTAGWILTVRQAPPPASSPLFRFSEGFQMSHLRIERDD